MKAREKAEQESGDLKIRATLRFACRPQQPHFRNPYIHVGIILVRAVVHSFNFTYVKYVVHLLNALILFE